MKTKNSRRKIQWAKRAGHLYKVCYGNTKKAFYGYGLTIALARLDAIKNRDAGMKRLARCVEIYG